VDRLVIKSTDFVCLRKDEGVDKRGVSVGLIAAQVVAAGAGVASAWDAERVAAMAPMWIAATAIAWAIGRVCERAP
jgi:hypothetical protein